MIKNNKTDLVEVKKNSVGNGLLIEHDGYISMSDKENVKLYESFSSNDGWNVPHPFIVSAVFQKFGIKNANGRIYPEDVLKKEVEKYQERINNRNALGECYTPDVLVLSKNGWVTMESIKEGDEVLTLNTETNNIEIQTVERKIEYDYNGDMIRIINRNINDLVTPNHGYPIYNRYNKFHGFYTADDIHNKKIKDQNHCYIPKTGEWNVIGDEFFTLEGVNDLPNKTLKKYPDAVNDIKINMNTFMKFLGIYLSEGHFRKNGYGVIITQKKESVCNLIVDLLIELNLEHTIVERKDGCKSFVIKDPRLYKFVKQFGKCYEKFIPTYFKNQSKEDLRTLYDWFVIGDGRVRKSRKNDTDDVFSTSKQLLLDLNEIQLKIGYSGTYHYGVFLDERYMKTSIEQYNGKVMCIEVKNHTFYVMSNGKCHWSKNCDHPESATIALDRISHNITELHWEGRTLIGKLEINTTHGFRQYGICSSLGDTIANLLLNGYKIGVSSRGIGDVEKDRLGNLVVRTFELLGWDVVCDPSTPSAYIAPNYDDLVPYMENIKKDNSLINEKIDKIKNILLS